MRHKGCRVLATVPEGPRVAPPGVTTTALAILPLALPVETPKMRIEFGLIGARTSTAHNVTLDVGLNSAQLDPPKAKRWRGRWTSLPLIARFGLGAATLAVLLGGLTMLPETVAASVRPDGAPPAAADIAYEFVGAAFEEDRDAALELASEQATTPRKQVDGVIEALEHEQQDELGPRWPQTPVPPWSLAWGYPFVEGMCFLGRPEVRGWIVMELVRPRGGESATRRMKSKTSPVGTREFR